MIFVLWVIYERPTDYPESFVLRKQYVKSHPSEVVEGATSFGDPLIAVDRKAWIAPTLHGLRHVIPNGLTRIPRLPGDDPKIVEVWV